MSANQTAVSATAALRGPLGPVCAVPISGCINIPVLPANESCVIGSLLESCPDTLPQHIGLLLRNAPQSFSDSRLGVVAATILGMRADGVPVSQLTVSERLTSKGNIDQVGGSMLLAQLANDAMSMTIAEHEGKTVWRGYQTRKSKSVLTDALDSLESSPQLAESIIGTAVAALGEVQRVEDGTAEMLLKRRFNHLTPPPAELTVYWLGDAEVSTAGNLTAISATIKTGKSAAVGAMVASAMDCGDAGDTLGFRSANPDGRALLWFDSEQSPLAHWNCVQRALRRGGRQEPPPWFYGYCLSGLGHKKAWECVVTAIKATSDKQGGLHSILLDGAADFVADVNDPAECNDFVAELQGLAISHGCPIVGVIHFNPGTEKTRGHLGSQLERKAESNLRMDKDANDVTEIWSGKQRGKPIPKGTGPRFAWSDEARMHVSVERVVSEKLNEERDTLKMLADKMFEQYEERQYSDLVSDLVLGVKKGVNLSVSTAKRRVQRMSELGIIIKTDASLWTRATYNV